MSGVVCVHGSTSGEQSGQRQEVVQQDPGLFEVQCVYDPDPALTHHSIHLWFIL